MILRTKTRKAKNRIQNHKGPWICIDSRMSVGFDIKGGPWLLISNVTHTNMFWVHAHSDDHFFVKNHKDTDVVIMEV